MKVKSLVKKILPNSAINFLKKTKTLPYDIVARHYLKKVKNKKKHNGIIRVGFCADFTTVWDKTAPVFELMKTDSRFKVILFITKTLYTKTEEEFLKVQKFFKELYPDAEYIIWDESLSIKNYDMDYFFYQRPYADLYPENLRVQEVRKYAKICYIPYGYAGSDVFNAGNTNKLFFRNVYLGFIEIAAELKILNEQFKHNIKKGYQSFEKLGYPSFEKYFNLPKKDFQGKVLWTPRWTVDDEVGGSHFFEYKDDFIEVAEKIDFIFRPHPLMFTNFIDKGIMSKESVDEYVGLLKKQNVEYSEGNPIEKDFMNADVLLTDYSSIIVEYFLTGKPIIYCKAHYEMNEEYNNLMKGIYIADTWEDVKRYLDDILNGRDYLKDERTRIISNQYADVQGASKRIVQRIVDDYSNHE